MPSLSNSSSSEKRSDSNPEVFSNSITNASTAATDPDLASHQEEPSSDGKNANINSLSEKLSEVALGQKRFLSTDTHHYEHFSLPATRVCTFPSIAFFFIFLEIFGFCAFCQQKL